MVRKIKLNWVKSEILEIKELLEEEIDTDLGGPLSILRYGRGLDYEQLGTLYRLIGKKELSKEYYKLASEVYYSFNVSTPPNNWDGYYDMYECAKRQFKSGICAQLSQNYTRSQDLFSWSLKNLNLPKETLNFWKPKEEGEDTTYAKIHLYEAYIFAQMEDFRKSLEKTTVANEAFEYFKKRNFKVDKEDRYPAKILIELAKYKLEPTQAQKKEAQEALDSYAIACGNNIDGLMNFLYIYYFQGAYPEIFKPVLPD